MMEEVSFDILLEKAKAASDWHHHFLTPHCLLNDQEKFKILLEADGKAFFTLFEEKPMDKLELLENLFFGRD